MPKIIIKQQPMTGVRRIALERRRQVVNEKMTYKHDDTYKNGELINAAIAYATLPQDRRYAYPGLRPHNWPWKLKWWKPSPNDRVKELVKAGALIAAEIDRLLRIKK